MRRWLKIIFVLAFCEPCFAEAPPLMGCPRWILLNTVGFENLWDHLYVHHLKYRDNVTGAEISPIEKYYWLSTSSGPDVSPVYSPGMPEGNGKNTVLRKQFAPRVVPPPTEAEILHDTPQTPRSNFDPSARWISHPDYPEVVYSDLTVAAPVYRRNHLKTELFPLSTKRLAYLDKPSLTVDVFRIQTVRNPNGSTLEICDVVKAKPFDLNVPVGTALQTAKGLSAERELLYQEGARRQDQCIKDVLDFAVPLFRERHPDWTESDIEKFKQQAYKTRDSTKYFVKRDSAGNIIATMGLSFVDYGKVKFFDLNRKNWIEMVGPFGSSFMLSQHGIRQRARQLPIPSYWNRPVDIVPAEMDFEFDRPGLPDDSSGLSQEQIYQRLAMDAELSRQGYHVDLRRGIFFYSGRLINPTKFAVAKNLGDHGLSNFEVLSEMTAWLWPSEFSEEFIERGTKVVGENTPTLARRYRDFGFEAVGEKDGWLALETTVRKILTAVQEIRDKLSPHVRESEAAEMIDLMTSMFGWERPRSK